MIKFLLRTSFDSSNHLGDLKFMGCKIRKCESSVFKIHYNKIIHKIFCDSREGLKNYKIKSGEFSLTRGGSTPFLASSLRIGLNWNFLWMPTLLYRMLIVPFLAPKGAYEVQMLWVGGSVRLSVCLHYALKLF